MKKKSDIPIVIIFISLVLFGIISFFYLDFNIIPEIEFPELILITAYPNSSPDEIDTMVTKPLEEMISSLKGVKNVSSVSREGISIIRIQYDWKSDLTEAHIELRDKVDQVAPFFPREVQRPIIMNYQPAMDAIAGIIVKSSLNPDDLYLLTNKDIKPVFERIEGISYVKLQGGTKPEIKIILKPEILNKYNIGINEIKEKIQNSNKDFPVGFYEENNREYQLRVKGRFDDYQDFGKIIIKNDREKVVTLADCAEIEYGSEIKRSGVLVDGNEQIVIMLYKQPGENVIQLSKRIKKELNNLNERYKDSLKFEYLFDDSQYITQSLSNLLIAIFFGVICTIISIIIFIYNVPISAVITLTIPISVIASFIFMRILNVSINLLSLGGISLAIGIIVDNSVIVVEALIEQFRVKEKDENYDREIKNISGAVISSTLTTIVVFLPIFFLSGILKIIFMQLVLIMVFSLILSMFAGIFLVPLMIRNVVISEKEYSLINWVNEVIIKSFTKLLNHAFKYATIYIVVLLILSTLGLIGYFVIPKTFMDSIPSDTFYIKIFIKKLVPYSYTKNFTSIVENIIHSTKGIKSTISFIGVDSNDLTANIEGIYGENTATIKVISKKQGSEIYHIISKLRKKFEIFSDVDFIFVIPDNPIQKLISRNEYNYVVKFFSKDYQNLYSETNKISELLKSNNLAVDIINSYYMTTVEKEVHINRDLLSRYQVEITSLAEFLVAHVTGYQVSSWKKNEYDIPVRLKVGESSEFDEQSFLLKTIKNNAGAQVFLKDLISINEKTSSSQIMKENQKYYAWIGFTSDAKTSVIEKLLKENISKDIEYSFTGQFSLLQENMSEIMLTILLALFLEYAILAVQFQSFRKPFFVMLIIPFSILGMFLILFVTGNSLNINTFMSIITLIGLLVNNGIMLFYDYDNAKASKKDQIIILTAKRIPAIFITQLSTILALITSFFSGNKIQISLAYNLSLGLIYSTLVNIIFLPIFYYYFYIQFKIRKNPAQNYVEKIKKVNEKNKNFL